MTATLAVRLLLSPTGEFNEAVIVGDIRPAGLDGTSLRNILVPCGRSPEPTSYPVDPGRYLVSVTLPSGMVLTKDAEAVDGRSAPVDFDMTDSPYGTHAWQYLMGNIEPERVYHGATGVPLPESVASRSMVAPAAADDGFLPESAVDVPARATWVGDSLPARWSYASMLALEQDPARPSVAPLIARSAPRPLPVPADHGADVTPLYRFGPDGPVSAPGDPVPVAGSDGPVPTAGSDSPAPAAGAGGPVGERQFLVVEAAGAVRLVTLPLPWGTSEVEVLVNLRQSPTGSAVAVTVRDPRLGAGIAYMAQGALDTAAHLLTDVGKALHSAPANPLAAAAGSYVLLGTDHRADETHWDPWLRLLADRYPWLSDGAILKAVRLLRRPGADLREARNGLVDAFDRGIPFYTLGLTWLADGLAAFPDDPECATRLDQVRRLSWLADMREPFLILDLRQGSA
ncbi:hypothetical protein [Streptomyces sp. NPDC127103]|uniref:hypothetical protein n=1 Tax=Streptomyces sp. NPDC127103 TaxID=3347139 RepID=UPI00364AC829